MHLTVDEKVSGSYPDSPAILQDGHGRAVMSSEAWWLVLVKVVKMFDSPVRTHRNPPQICADVIGMAYSGDLKSYGPVKGIGGSTPPIGTNDIPPHVETADEVGSNPTALCVGVRIPLWRPFCFNGNECRGRSLQTETNFKSRAYARCILHRFYRIGPSIFLRT